MPSTRPASCRVAFSAGHHGRLPARTRSSPNIRTERRQRRARSYRIADSESAICAGLYKQPPQRLAPCDLGDGDADACADSERGAETTSLINGLRAPSCSSDTNSNRSPHQGFAQLRTHS